MKMPALALALAALAGPAMAAGEGDWNVSGDLARACSITFDCAADDTCLDLQLENRSTAQNTATVTWQCNYAIDAATMEFTSQNRGLLDNPDDDQGLPYLATYTGGENSGFTERSLATPVITNPTATTPGANVSGFIQVTLQPRTLPLFAGGYTDEITVTITPEGP
jgi:hypothetical protein